MLRLFRFLIVVAAVLVFSQNLQAQLKDPFEHRMDDTLSTVTVTAVKEKPRNTTQTGLVRLDTEMLKRGASSFGTPDIIKTLLNLPGVSAGNELMGGMYVHGGDGTDNLYLLDGVPLYNISHFGGIFSSFNTDVTDGLDFYKSGFPARYGTKLSSVVDVTTRPGDMHHIHGSASIGLIDGRINVEGPIVKGRTSFNLAYRRSWMDMMIWLAMKIGGDDGGRKAAYFMHDFNAGITHDFGRDNRLRVNFYRGSDDLDLGLKPTDSSLDLAVKWGNLCTSVNWDKKLSLKTRSSLMGYFSQSRSDTDYGIVLGGYDLADRINSSIRDAGVRYNLDWYPHESHHIRTGIDGAYKMYRYVGMAEDPSDPDSYSPTVSKDAPEVSLYMEDEFFIVHGLTLNAGLRHTSYFTPGKTWHSLEPRAALKLSPAYFMDIKLSYSRMSQSDHLVASSYIDLPSNTWMPSTSLIRPELSDQISAGVYTEPVEGMTLNLEGWYKTMDHLLQYTGINSMFPPVQNWETSFTEGRGLSYGLESEIGYRTSSFSATAYYTLGWSKRSFPEVYPKWFWANNDNRHKVNLLFSYKVMKDLEVSANWNYHTGNRITLPTNVLADGTQLYDTPFNFTLPSYHRLDLAITYTMKSSKGNDFDLSASVYNAYNNKNAFFAYVEKDENGDFNGIAYSVLPVFPTLTITYRF